MLTFTEKEKVTWTFLLSNRVNAKNYAIIKLPDENVDISLNNLRDI